MIFERLSTHRAIKGCFYYTNIEREIIMDEKAIEIVKDYIGEHLDKFKQIKRRWFGYAKEKR